MAPIETIDDSVVGRAVEQSLIVIVQVLIGHNVGLEFVNTSE